MFKDKSQREEKLPKKGKKDNQEPIKNEVVEEVKEEPVEEVKEEPKQEVSQMNIMPKSEPKKVENSDDISFRMRKILKKSRQAKKKRQNKYNKKDDKLETLRYNPNPDLGLSQDLVDKRIDDGLTNNTKTGSTKSIKKIIFSNIFTFFNILTLTIAGILISVRAFTDLFFVVIVTCNVVIGIIQEIKAKNTIDKLSVMSAPTAFVIRGGKKSEVSITEVVLDDIIVLESGKQIPADAIMIDGSVEVNESLLTGESDAISKKSGDTLHAGSFVVSGNCRARVDKIGKDTYLSRMTGEAKLYKKPKSDLLKSLNWIIRFMAVIIIPIGVTLFYMQYITGGVDYVTAIRKTAGAMVGMIPSGLMLLSSVALAVGVVRLAQNKVMVQELYCIEMLARVNCLCLDKTGTITDGTMSVKDIVEFDVDFGISPKVAINGMLNALKESNLTQKALEERFGSNRKIKYTSLIHFSSQRKYNAVSFERYGTFIMGAPEFVLLDKFAIYQKQIEAYSRQGYRVLALAHKDGLINNGILPLTPTVLVALVLIEDNIRPDAIETIKYFKESGVEVKVISGDNPLTVAKISERAGIDNTNECISLDGMSDEDVFRSATRYTVFGRVSPDQKRILVKALKEAGKTVAMTGDGVNDILALREADCSIAMASGSEAARNVSHLVLLDSNFSSMPKVVAEGRRVINNVSSVACLFLTKTIFSFLLAVQAMLSGGIYPISTVQLSMIDFLVVGIPSFFLVLEPNNAEVDSNFLKKIIKGALPGALTILLLSALAFKLTDFLNYDMMTSSTIIIITATHTCLMVLFKVCKPLNFLRKCICTVFYTLFVAFTIFLPSLFELRPFFKFMEYNSETVEITRLESTPYLEVSKANQFVLDGIVYDTKATTDYEIMSTSSENGLLTINTGQGAQIIYKDGQGYKIVNPDLSIDDSGNLYAGGYITQCPRFNPDPTKIKLKIDTDGKVTIMSVQDDGTESPVSESLQPNYSILPTISVNSAGYLVINGRDYSEYTWSDGEIETVSLDAQLRILINGELYTYEDVYGTSHYISVDMPAITFTEDEHIVIGATAIKYSNIGQNVTLNTIGFNSLADLLEYEEENEYADKVIQAHGSYYNILFISSEATTHLQTNIEIVIPTIATTVADRCIIDGHYTNYDAQTIGGTSEVTFNVTEDGHLIINDFVTDYEADYSVTTGGTVQRLTIPAMLILFTLCLASAPVMRILNGFFPWLKRTIKSVQNILSRF